MSNRYVLLLLIDCKLTIFTISRVCSGSLLWS